MQPSGPDGQVSTIYDFYLVFVVLSKLSLFSLVKVNVRLLCTSFFISKNKFILYFHVIWF